MACSTRTQAQSLICLQYKEQAANKVGVFSYTNNNYSRDLHNSIPWPIPSLRICIPCSDNGGYTSQGSYLMILGERAINTKHVYVLRMNDYRDERLSQLSMQPDYCEQILKKFTICMKHVYALQNRLGR